MTEVPNPRLPQAVPLHIGRLIIAMARLEAILHLSFAALTKDDGTITEIILSRIDSIRYKIDVIMNLAELSQQNELSRILRQHSALIDRATKMRNDLAHSQFGIDDDNKITIIKNAFRLKAAHKVEAFDPQEVKALVDQLDEAMESIANVTEGSSILVRRTRNKGK